MMGEEVIDVVCEYRGIVEQRGCLGWCWSSKFWRWWSWLLDDCEQSEVWMIEKV
jgi:hypothetical protein